MSLGGPIDLPSIRQRITVDDSALGGLGARFGKVGKVLGGAIVAGAGAAAVGVGLFAAAGTKGAIDVERGIAEVVTLFGETGDAARTLADELSAGVAGLSDEVGIAQDVLVGGLYQAISAGVPKDNAFEFLKVASKASIAGVTDVETAVDGITTTVNAFGLEASRAEDVADSMFAAVQGGKTTFEELASNLGQVAPLAAAAGVSFEEVNAAVATLTSAGGSTAERMTQIKAALSGLQRPSEELTEIFRAAGYESAQAALESDGLAAALGVVADAADGDNGKMQQLLGSVEAVAAASVIAGTGADKMTAELERQQGAAGASADAFDTMEQTTTRAFEKIKTRIQNAAITVGSEILPVLAEVTGTILDRVVPAIQSFAGWLGDLISGAREIGSTMSGVGDTFAGVWSMIGSVIDEVGFRIREVVGKIVDTFRRNEATVSETFGIIRETIQTVLADVTAIVSGVLEIVGRLWDVFGDEIIATVRDAFRIVSAVIKGVLGVIRGIVDVVMGLLTGDWDRAWGGIRRIVTSVWDTIRTVVETAVGTIRRRVTAVWDAVKGATSDAWERVKGAVRDGIDGVVAWVKGLPGRIVDAIGNVSRTLYNAGKNVLQGLIDGMKAKVSAIKDTIESVVQEIRDRLPFSPAKKGPLSGSGSPDRAGAKIGSMIASGLENTTGRVASAANRVAAAAGAPLPGFVDPTVGTGGLAAAGAAVGSTFVEINTHDAWTAARAFDVEMGYRNLVGGTAR